MHKFWVHVVNSSNKNGFVHFLIRIIVCHDLCNNCVYYAEKVVTKWENNKAYSLELQLLEVIMSLPILKRCYWLLPLYEKGSQMVEQPSFYFQEGTIFKDFNNFLCEYATPLTKFHSVIYIE